MKTVLECKEDYAKTCEYANWGSFLMNATNAEVNMALNVVAQEYKKASLTEFYKDVKRMRELQKQYFKTRRKDVLASSKLFESKVDKQIQEIENPNLF